MTNRTLPPLTALQAFEAAGTAGSFQEAARILRVTPSAVSHQIKALEQWLGRPLFERGARRIALTAEGRSLLRTVRGAFARIAEQANGLRGTKGKTLRISALPLFTSDWLIPRLGRFEENYPEISLEIETTNRIVDLKRDNVDVAIRNLRSPPGGGLAAVKLLDVRPAVVCTAKLAAQLRTPSDLATQTLIHVTARSGVWAGWLKAVGSSGLKSRRTLSFDTVPAALEAAAQGRGVAIGIDPLIWESPVASKLVQPFRLRVPGDASYYLVHRREDGVRPDINAFVTWIRKEMALFKRRARKLSVP